MSVPIALEVLAAIIQLCTANGKDLGQRLAVAEKRECVKSYMKCVNSKEDYKTFERRFQECIVEN